MADSGQDSLSVVREFFAQVVNKGDGQSLKNLVDDTGTGYVAGDSQPRKGQAGVLKGINTFRSASPDFTVTIDDIFSSGDKVAVRWSGKGTHKSHFEGVAGSGQAVSLTGMDIYRVENGKIVEGWSQSDSLSLIRQLKSVPLAFLSAS